jgi:hypothetical protein
MGNQFGHGLHRQTRRHHQHVHRRDHRGDRREILVRIVRQLLHQIRIGDLGSRRGPEQRVAIRRCLGDEIGAESRAAARLILDHDRLAQAFAERVRQNARHQVCAAAWRERHHKADRTCRIGLRLRATGCERQHHRGECP